MVSSQMPQIDQIDEGFIRNLVDTKELEDRYLEYKYTLKIDDEKGQEDLFKDVSAMANTASGFIIYGIEEEKTKMSNRGHMGNVGLGKGGYNYGLEQEK